MDPHHHHPCHHHPAAGAASAACCCHTPPPPPPPHFYHPNLSQPHHPAQQVNFHNYPCDRRSSTHPPPEPRDQAAIHSLLRRIAALESSLAGRLPAARHSLRDAAARTIQTHFRAFLVRRSRTLRQLKTLASVKSALVALKMSVSDGSRVDWRAVSRKAMELLLKMDSIQGGDLMIRDGKRSISRDLDRLLGSIDGLYMNTFSSTMLKNSRTRVLYNGQQFDVADIVSSNRDERGSNRRMRARVESTNEFYHIPDYHDDEQGIIELENFRILNDGKIGSLPKRNGGLAKMSGGNQGKAKKNVSFAEDGDLSRVFVSTREPNSSDDGSVDEEKELVDNLRGRVQKIAVTPNENGDDVQEAYMEDEESSQISNGVDHFKRSLIPEGHRQPR